MYKRQVLDRTMLILDIFTSRAVSGEGKLQVELARLQYQLPRLAGRGVQLLSLIHISAMSPICITI